MIVCIAINTNFIWEPRIDSEISGDLSICSSGYIFHGLWCKKLWCKFVEHHHPSHPKCIIIGLHPYCMTDWLTDQLTDGLIVWIIEWLIIWLGDWLFDQLMINWLIGWFSGPVICWFICSSIHSIPTRNVCLYIDTKFRLPLCMNVYLVSYTIIIK